MSKTFKLTIDAGPPIEVDGALADTILAALDSWQTAGSALSAAVKERIKDIEALIATQMQSVEAQDAPHITGPQVQEIRARMGLNQAELAERLGVASRTIRSWEKEGIRSGHLSKYLRIVAQVEDLKIKLAARHMGGYWQHDK